MPRNLVIDNFFFFFFKKKLMVSKRGAEEDPLGKMGRDDKIKSGGWNGV